MKTINRTRLQTIVIHALSQSSLSDADRDRVLAAVDNPENKQVGVGGGFMEICPLGLAGLWSEGRGWTLSEGGAASSFYALFDQLMDRALDGAGNVVRVIG